MGGTSIQSKQGGGTLGYKHYLPRTSYAGSNKSKKHWYLVSAFLSQDAKEAVAAALLKAGDYLNAKWEMVNDPVQMCMIAYAFNLMGHYAKDATFLRAHDMRREGKTERL